MAQVALDEKMAFGYYKLPVVVDNGRYSNGGDTPVMGVWCPELNDRLSILTCSSCPQFGGLVQDDSLHTFVRCRCHARANSPAGAPGDSGIILRARKLSLGDGEHR